MITRRLQNEMKFFQRTVLHPNIAMQPSEDSMLIWYFALYNLDGEEYLGRIDISTEYPFKQPQLMLITPNSKYNTFEPICINSQNEWSPKWNLQTLLITFLNIFEAASSADILSIINSKEYNRTKYPELIQLLFPDTITITTTITARKIIEL